ncbi:peptidase U32 family protein [Bacillus velezensis]|uniref:peptidase U32 family protein n=1 Tax=Bacillus velezensis TaxID=492670 RepID=UPI000B8C3F2C|nr:peptidase U32 family protein [Bacillus velezensis]ASP27035.1 collagenase-like protease [Bacillus velezensis]ATO11820.1 collagenase-like protease [Bacillus velezensis]MEC1511429.1 U32 family peptidase [Bacillus velezensis]MEC2278803.1 U32 family peptidase [Bacillus velezensis]MED3701296.1 U32 family peptidase [Bacillus velezensis]
MKKPELLVTPTSVQDILPLIQAGATALLVGEQRYGLRLAGEFSREDIKEAVKTAHQEGAKVYAAVNAIFHNEKVDELNGYLAFLQEAGVDAAVFGDPAVLMAAREAAPELKLHWSTETTGTNYYSCNYWGRKGARRAVLAKELNMDSIIDIKENAEVEIEIQIHGMTCMFQSKRSLVGHYFEYQGKVMDIEQKKKEAGMFLHDKERGNKYPIFEDENGTHIMSPNDVCMIDELEDLMDAGIDSFKIDGVLKSPEYLTEVTRMYREAIDLCSESRETYEEKKESWIERIESIQPVNRSIDTGFFFKETVY